jgi:CelD/BcsL family acetyltransferase involved in cellulose biosynthesis
VASLSKHDRHELRRKLRNLEAAGDVAYDAVSGDTPGEVDALLALMRASHTEKGAFLTPSMEAFFRDLSAEFGALGMARIGSLRLDGRVAAKLFTFETAGATYLYNSGYDPQFSHLAVGLLSKAIAIRGAMAAGKQRFDFLRGEEDYKHRLGGTPRDIYRYVVEAKPGTIV